MRVFWFSPAYLGEMRPFSVGASPNGRFFDFDEEIAIMDVTAAVHPSDQTLHAYGLGKLDDVSAESVTSTWSRALTASAGLPT